MSNNLGSSEKFWRRCVCRRPETRPLCRAKVVQVRHLTGEGFRRKAKSEERVEKQKVMKKMHMKFMVNINGIYQAVNEYSDD